MHAGDAAGGSGPMTVLEGAYRRLVTTAPASVALRMDMLRRETLADTPLNGQGRRQQLARDLLSALDFDEVVETGTHRAASTLFFRHVSGLPVRSVELLPRFFHFAQARCAPDRGVELTLGDSRAFLSALAARSDLHRTFFYLDAHWQPDSPRYGELKLIWSAWTRAVVMIDDVQVPDDPGYGFARYGDRPLTVESLAVPLDWACWYPAARSTEETGARRGCLVLASPALAPQVAAVPGLRPVPR